MLSSCHKLILWHSLLDWQNEKQANFNYMVSYIQQEARGEKEEKNLQSRDFTHLSRDNHTFLLDRRTDFLDDAARRDESDERRTRTEEDLDLRPSPTLLT